MSESSVFKTMSDVEVSNKVRQKGQFWYISWANAVRELLKKYPEATWSFTKFGENQIPYLKTEAGCFVECTVTVNGLSRTQMLPVLDFKNKAVTDPDSMQVNKSQMRALTKAIALHGFGLDLWAGEDLDAIAEMEEIENGEVIDIQDVKKQFDECKSIDEANKLFVHYGEIASDKKDRDLYRSARDFLRERVGQLNGDNHEQ